MLSNERSELHKQWPKGISGWFDRGNLCMATSMPPDVKQSVYQGMAFSRCRTEGESSDGFSR
jgi:hypothetical protein